MQYKFNVNFFKFSKQLTADCTLFKKIWYQDYIRVHKNKFCY